MCYQMVLTISLFCENTAPNPNLFASVSKRNGLLKSAKANTGTLREVFLRFSKASLALAMIMVSLTCSSYGHLPQMDACVKVVQYMQTP